MNARMFRIITPSWSVSGRVSVDEVQSGLQIINDLQQTSNGKCVISHVKGLVSRASEMKWVSPAMLLWLKSEPYGIFV